MFDVRYGSRTYFRLVVARLEKDGRLSLAAGGEGRSKRIVHRIGVEIKARAEVAADRLARRDVDLDAASAVRTDDDIFAVGGQRDEAERAGRPVAAKPDARRIR